MSGFIPEQRRRSNAKLLDRITVCRGDLTAQGDVDAVVSAAMTGMDLRGSLNQSLIAAAGNDFDEFMLENIYRPRAGDTYVLPGFNLPAPNVIFVFLPFTRDKFDREDADLLRCYRHAMEAARNSGFKKVAFPALGTGGKRYPVSRAARLGLQGIIDRIGEDFDEVRIVCNRDNTFNAFTKRLEKLKFYSMP